MGSANVGMRIQPFDPNSVKVNPAIAARRGDPDKKKIERLASNMVERHLAGQTHQIQPGVVRILDDDTAELIIGRHRMEAVKVANSKAQPDEPFTFYAVAIPSTDEQALLDAIDENEYRTATTVFDKGEAWQKLIDLGKSQKEIAERYGVPESTVSDYRAASKLPKKLQQAVEQGKLTEEGAIALARYNKDPQLQEELFALANQEREAREAIMQRAEARSKGEAEADAGTSESGSKKGSKAAPTSEAVKGKRKTPSGRTTGKDVKTAAKKKGVAKRGSGPDRKSLRDLVTLLQAKYGEKVEEEVPEPYLYLAQAIEEFYDGKLGDQAFINRWEKAVRDKFAASKAA